MRKRTVEHVADTWFWYIVYAMPFVCYVLAWLFQTPQPFVDFMTDNLGFIFTANNPILTAFSGLFATDGILPLFTDMSAIYIGTWFISTYIFHLFVDFVLFVPRLCHKWLSKCYQGD